MRMRTVGVLSLLFFISLSLPAGAFDGPLQVRNQFPIFLHLNAPFPESAALGDTLSASLSHSSVHLVRNSHGWTVDLDMEITEITFRFRKTVRNFIELGIDLPLLSFSSGFMDGFLKDYHDTFGFPDYGRSRRPDNEFLYEVRKGGTLVVKGKNGRSGPGDIRFTAKKPFLSGNPAVSIKGEIELPTGDAHTGFGSGSFGAGLAVLSDAQLSEKFKSYLNIGVVFPGNLRALKKVDIREFIYGSAAIEAALWKNIGIVGQVLVHSSPFPETDIPSVDRTAVLLSFGGRYSSGKNSLEVSFTEDPNTSGAPDFTMNFSFRRLF